MAPMTPTATRSRHELDVYGKRGITLVRGRGARLWDDTGREYIDCMSAHGAAILGHAHPRIAEALERQARTLTSCPGSFYHPGKEKLIERLAERCPSGLDRVFLCNSGTEAVEAAIKFARASTGRPAVVAAKRGFHGRTFGAMSASFNPKHHELYAPIVPGTRFIAFNDTAALEDALEDDVSMLLLELVQGEGGVHVAEPSFILRAQELCRERGVLLVIDEVQTGFGRTGGWFACSRYGLSPDILCLAKGIAGGFPMGAAVVNDKVQVDVGMHGSTFGGNPLACAVANAVFDVLESKGFLESIAEKGRYLKERLRAIDSEAILEVRGRGLMVGIALKQKARPYLEALAEQGVLALTAGPKVLRLLPPLVITEEELEQVVETLVDILRQ